MVLDSFTFKEIENKYFAFYAKMWKSTLVTIRRSEATHQDVVGFDVSMQYVASLQQFEGQEKLLAVWAHSLDVQPHVLAVLPQHLPQVHAKASKEYIHSA